jgi:hypothetical protein
MVSFDLVAGSGPVVTVDRRGRRHRRRPVVHEGRHSLGSERIGSVVWHVYDQPDLGGPVYVTTYPDGVEVVVAGGAERGPLRTLARSLESPL